jgi:hypothetical protein
VDFVTALNRFIFQTGLLDESPFEFGYRVLFGKQIACSQSRMAAQFDDEDPAVPAQKLVQGRPPLKKRLVYTITMIILQYLFIKPLVIAQKLGRRMRPSPNNPNFEKAYACRRDLPIR